MTDVFTVEKRSDVMSRIRSRGNRDTELRLIALFRSAGIKGWRRHSSVFGEPDFVFPKGKIAVFADGCFWHACPIHFQKPKQNAEFWEKKISANIERDRVVNEHLQELGWHVLRIWEHELEKGGASAAEKLKAAFVLNGTGFPSSRGAEGSKQ